MKNNTLASQFPQLTSWVGFDRLFDELDRVTTETFKKIPNWPPYNVRKIDEDHYAIEVACAGFGKSDIEITTKDGVLTIKGEVKPDTEANYLYKGIAERSFERSIRLADTVVVKNASMVNGLLRIWMENVIPENKKPRKVEINDLNDTSFPAKEKTLLTE